MSGAVIYFDAAQVFHSQASDRRSPLPYGLGYPGVPGLILPFVIAVAHQAP